MRDYEISLEHQDILIFQIMDLHYMEINKSVDIFENS